MQERRADRSITGSGGEPRAGENQPHACALALIEQLAFRTGMTMAHVPHEYTTRDRRYDDARVAAYVGLFDLIQAYGVIERCEGQARRYLPVGNRFENFLLGRAPRFHPRRVPVSGGAVRGGQSVA